MDIVQEQDALRAELADLRRRLDEAEQIVEAIHANAVDAFVVADARGERVYTLETADRPYRRLVEAMQEGALTLGADGTILFCNGRFAELVGASAGDLLGTSLASWIAADQRGGFATFAADAATGVRRGEFSIARHDGTTCPVELTANPFEDNRGNRICVVVADLTERKRFDELRRVQAALQRSEADYRMLFEAAGVGNSEVDAATGRILRANRRFCAIVGYAEDELRSMTFSEVTHPDDRARVAEAVAAHEDGFELEKRCLRKDGTSVWVHLTSTPVGLPGPRRMIESVIDISERKAAEEALRLSESRFRTLADSVALVIWVTNAAGDIELVNRAYEQFFGVREDDVRRDGWQPLVHVDDAPRYVEAFLAATRERRPYHARARVRRADGAWRWIESRAEPRLSDDGDFLGMVGSSADVTDEVEAEEALRAADRRKDEFLATLAHELRNPLAPLRTGIQIVRRTPPDAAPHQRALEMMDRQVGHMVRIIDDLLDVSRITTGKLKLAVHPLDVCAVVSSAVEAAIPLSRALERRIELALPGHPVIVDGDETRLHQVIGNVLHNAIKFTEPGGTIWVGVDKDRDAVAIRVRDDGAGIPPEHLATIFDMFTQIPRSMGLGRQEGLGIGLHLARRLVEMHGGTIAARSEGPKRGAEFTVRLPCRPAAAPRTGPAGGDHARVVRPARILVVDDNADAADTIALLLELDGHEVARAYDGAHALSIAGDFRPELAIVDLWMPGMDGLAFAREFRARFGDAVRLWALSGLGQDEDVRRARDAGFDAFLVKPVDAVKLQERIASLSPVSA